jgi:hypothetical protein
VLSVALDRPDLADQFFVENDCPSTLPQGERCSVSVTFFRIPALDAVANLVIENSATEDPIQILLTGVPDPQISVGEFDYNSDTDLTTAPVTVTNPGSAPFDVLDVVTTDPAFSIQTHDCGTVRIDGSCSITLSVQYCGEDPLIAELVLVDSTVQQRHSAPLEFANPCVD